MVLQFGQGGGEAEAPSHKCNRERHSQSEISHAKKMPPRINLILSDEMLGHQKRDFSLELSPAQCKPHSRPSPCVEWLSFNYFARNS